MKPVVLVNGQDPTTGRGGGSTYVRAHARAARRAGFEPHVFSLGDRDSVVEADFGVVHRVACPLRPRGPFAVAPGAPAERLAHWAATYAFSPHAVAAHAPRLVRAVDRFLGRANGERLVHGFSTWGAVGVALRARRRGRVRAVTSLYTPVAHEARAMARGAEGWARWSSRVHLALVERTATPHERRAWARSDLVLVNYESVRRLFVRAHGSGAAVRRVPYAPDSAFVGGLDAESDEPAAVASLRPRDAPLVVAVSRHDPRKGYGVLIEALARLRGAGTRFRACLVGGGPLLAVHRREVAARGLGDAVVLAGSVESPRPFLRRADAFVLPSLQEASGSLSVLEALQSGVPVVASGIDGILEDVTHGEDALLVPAGDPARLAEALARLLADPGLRARLAARGLRTFRARFSSDGLCDAIRAAYASVGFEP